MVSVCGENLRVNSWVKWISGKFCGEKSDGFKRIILWVSGCSRAVVEIRGCFPEVKRERWYVREKEEKCQESALGELGGGATGP